MTQKFHKSTPAEQLMAIEVFAELLTATDPARVGQKLVEQLRELTGARTIFLVSHPDKGLPCHKILAVSPEKRSGLFNSNELDLLCPDCTYDVMPHVTADYPEDHPLQPMLLRTGVESILRFPLEIQGRLVAYILVLDLPEIRRIQESVMIINHLSPVIALAIKNSLTYEQTELMVARRTAELLESNTRLTQALQEKEILLRELYHRTKNTMQVIESLLTLQAGKYEENEEVQNLVKITNQRIGTISLVQKMLYTSRDLSRISIQEFLAGLCRLLEESLAIPGTRVRIALDVNEGTWLIDTMNPCGLVLTELVTNSYKYAFAGKTDGRISISLKTDDQENTCILYEDDGCGLPPDFGPGSPKTFGLHLITTIIQYQMKGTVEFLPGPGFRCRITFPKTRYELRI